MKTESEKVSRGERENGHGILKAPFPWFGGKSRCAHLVWPRFGEVPNYVEPFCGSLAVALGRPHPARTETFNDKDCYLANFWRAVTQDPEAVAQHADWPVNEADLHARHRWLVNQHGFRHRMMHDPDYFDAKIAGRWVWGISQWIGSGWCSRPEWVGRTLPGRSPRGIQTNEYHQRPNLMTENGVHAKRVNLRKGGTGIHATFLDRRMPDLGGNSGAVGKGIHKSGLHRKSPTFKRALGSGVLRSEFQVAKQIPQLRGDSGATGQGVIAVGNRAVTSRMGQWKTRPFLTRPGSGVQSQLIRENLIEYMRALQDRLRRARVCCGDWQRVLGPSPTTCIGVTAVFLDPPYSHRAERDGSIYNHDCLDVAEDVRAWAIEHGHDPKLRIALCGYEGEHTMPKSWACVPWKANGGYGNQANGRGRANAGKERIWFSPYCLKV